ncbi:hypothetical protein OG874_02545 [Nocardia sp. NBC_00565]|uniref:hypothetical protein n=1 Tax=Nocardia sp. NBC_00565 TaxID=2975993 RepID=UPI002E7FC557|nr:hypothetical protein [Nocardia sp. NBC_00565]WUC04117.1 hypothetical protein OG874_02545 [Nocardia sp. NBC_00565]
MTNFSVDLNRLVSASRAWSEASQVLGVAAGKAQEIADSNKDVIWAMWADVWEAQLAAARYVNARLLEGKAEASSIGNILDHVAKVYQEQDQRYANVIIKLTETL